MEASSTTEARELSSGQKNGVPSSNWTIDKHHLRVRKTMGLTNQEVSRIEDEVLGAKTIGRDA